VSLVLAELDPAARILSGDEQNHPPETVIGHEGFNRVVRLLEILVGEDLVDGAVAIPAEGQGILAAATLWDEVVICGV
jgi:hypothetical protein